MILPMGRLEEMEEGWTGASSPPFSAKEGYIHLCEHIDGSVLLHSEGG